MTVIFGFTTEEICILLLFTHLFFFYYLACRAESQKSVARKTDVTCKVKSEEVQPFPFRMDEKIGNYY